MKNPFKTLLQHTSIYSIAEIASRGMGFLLIPFYTRYLSPADYGILEIIFITQGILLIFANQGIGSALFKFWTDTPEQYKSILASSTLWYELFSASIIAIIGIIFSSKISLILLKTERYKLLFILLFVSLTLASFNLILMQILRARYESIKVSTLSLIKLAISVGINIYLIAFLGLGVISILISEVVSNGIYTVVGYIYTKKYITFVVSIRDLKKVLSFGIPLIGVGLSGWILTAADRYFLANFTNETELGLYSLAYKFSLVLNVILLKPFLTTWPTIYFDVSKRNDAKKFFSKVLRYFTLIGCIAGMAMTILSSIAIQIMTPHEYWLASGVVYLLIASVICEGICNIFVVGLYITSHTNYPSIATGIAAITNLILNYYFIPKWGMIGAASASVIAYSLMALMMLKFSQKYYYIKYSIIRIVLMFNFFLVLGWLFNKMSYIGIMTELIIGTILFSAMTSIGIIVLLQKNERQESIRFIAKYRNFRSYFYKKLSINK